jgi:hypothetical protein
MWNALETDTVAPKAHNVVFGVDRALNWEAATITANVRVGDVIKSQVIYSTGATDFNSLLEVCDRLGRKWMGHFVADGNTLRDLILALRDDKGHSAEYLTQNQVMNACSTSYALIASKNLIHGDDPLLADQVPKAVIKSNDSGWKITRRDSSGNIDALMATIMGCYVAKVRSEESSPFIVASS